jgi:Fe2+ or Zn2+ uptake regulation protein
MKRVLVPNPLDAYLEILRAGKVKVTANRRKVLARFLEVDAPWTLKSLHQSLSQDEECDSSSIYRTLEALRAAGLLEEFKLPGDKQTFYSLMKPHGLDPIRSHAHSDHHHHHILCQDCGKVSHLDICMPAAWLGKVENASGFEITEHRLEFKGRCSDCR